MCYHSKTLSLYPFFSSIAVVTILDLVLSFPAEISPGGDVSLAEDSIQGSSHVVYHQSLMVSAFQEAIVDNMIGLFFSVLLFHNETDI